MSMLFNVLAGQVAGEKLVFDPSSSNLYLPGSTKTITDTYAGFEIGSETENILICRTNAADFSGGLSGVYFKITPSPSTITCYTGLADEVYPTGPSGFWTFPSITKGDDGGTPVSEIFAIGQAGFVSPPDSTSGPWPVGIDNSVEWCVAYDESVGAFGTTYVFSSSSPNTIVASHTHAYEHPTPTRFVAYIGSDSDIGVEIIRNPTVSHAGVRNVGA